MKRYYKVYVDGVVVEWLPAGSDEAAIRIARQEYEGKGNIVVTRLGK